MLPAVVPGQKLHVMIAVGHCYQWYSPVFVEPERWPTGMTFAMLCRWCHGYAVLRCCPLIDWNVLYRQSRGSSCQFDHCSGYCF